MVKITIGNTTSRIIGQLPPEVNEALDMKLSYMLPSAHHIKSVKEGRWDGRIRLYKKSYGQFFETGLLSIVQEILKEHNVEFHKVDERRRPKENLPHLTFTPFEGYQERDYQQFTIDRAYKRTRGILKVATGGGKCLGRGTPILMFDGSTKPVEEVVRGDQLMGVDSTPRTVLTTTAGWGDLYKVSQKNGDDYICNDVHILCCEQNHRKHKGKRIEITAEDYYNSSKHFKHVTKGYKVGVSFPETKLPVHPYFVGLWLGDGNSGTTSITTGDVEIEEYIHDFADKNDLLCNEQEEVGNCVTLRVVKNDYSNVPRGKILKNSVRSAFYELNLFQNKHIPEIYKVNSRANRLLLLAGLIDSDGNFAKPGAVEFSNKNKRLASDVCWLARSLGFRSSLNEKWQGDYLSYRVRISGRLSLIPSLLKRKQAGDKTKYEAMRYGVSVNPIGEGEYFGFEIDGDRKFLLGDFTVTHNTMIVAELIGKIKTGPFMFYVLTKDLMEQAHETLSATLNEPIGRIGGGEFDVQNINVCTVQTVIKAVNSKNKKFKISDYQFDEEDVWDKNDILSEDKNEVLKSLLKATKGLYLDECIAGDSIVSTEFGETRIDEIIEKRCRYVLTHDGNKSVYKKINNFWDKGAKPVYEITLANGAKIKCTNNHLILTNTSWKKAESLTTGEKVLFASAGAELGSKETPTVGNASTFWGIRLKKGQRQSGEPFLKNTSPTVQNVHADVETKLDHQANHWMRSYGAEEPYDTQSICGDTTSAPFTLNIISTLLRKSAKPLSELALETPLCSYHMEDQRITDYAQLMGYAKKNGLNINETFYHDTELNREQLNPKVTENLLLYRGQDACAHLQTSQKKFMKVPINEFLSAYWTNWGGLGSHGGCATTDRTLWDAFLFTLKAFASLKTPSSLNGSTKTEWTASSKNISKKKTHFTISDSQQKAQRPSLNASHSTSLDACDTSWQTIKSIKKLKGLQKVYDIEVEDMHCFFANGIMVHNCHHSAARTCQDVLNASPDAFWRFGGSATPYREDGAELMIQALFGRKIVDISASYLIKNGFLLKPYIFFEPIQHDCNLHSYRGIYSECVTKNDEFNDHVADTANFLVENGLMVIVLVQHIHHGKYLHKLIPNSMLVTGGLSNKRRKEAIQDFRDRKYMCMLATSLADEGLDVPAIDVALLPGGGASATRVHQRIGRTLRPDFKSKNPNDKSIVIYYKHDVKYLKNHANKALRIMKAEPEFQIIKSKGKDHILREISELMEFNHKPKNIFDL